VNVIFIAASFASSANVTVREVKTILKYGFASSGNVTECITTVKLNLL